MPLSILCSVNSVAGLESKLTVGVITAASFVLPTALGSISIQSITGTYTSFTVSRTGGGLANFTSTVQNFPTNSFTDPTVLNNNSQYTYTITPTNNSVAGTAFSAITNTTTGLSNGLIYSLASAPTLTYNGAGSSTSAISFTFTGGSYTNLSVQFPSGTFIATTTVSPYTGGSFGPNTQNTYYVFAINGDNYGGLTAAGTGTNVTASSTSVSVCTWASAPTLTYNGAGSSQNAISFTYSGGTFSSLSIQTTLGSQIDTSTVSPYTSPSLYSINQQITYYACPVNQLSYYSTTTNYASVSVCTWASAPTLTYNGAGSSQNAMSFTYSGGTFTSLSIQTTLGSQIDTSTVSPYTSPSLYSINQQIIYYACPVNQLSYYSTTTNFASVSVCTWASCNAPTFASTSSSGTTLTDTGTFSNVLINYSGGTASPASGTTFTGTNTITQAYTLMASSTTYTFTCFPVNALNYQSTNSASAGVTTSSGAPSPVLLGTYAVAWSFPSGGSTRPGYSIACSSTGQYVSFCCNLKIYYSSNYGVSFNTYTSTTNMYAITMSSSGQYQLAVSTGIPACSIYQSTNFGVTWTIPKANVTSNNGGRWFQSVCISSDGSRMFCGGSGGAGLQNYRSDNFGTTWSGAIGGILGRNSCAMLYSSGLVYASQNLNTPIAIMSITTTTETTGTTLPAQVWFITSNGSTNWYYINSSNNGFYSSNSGTSYGSAVSSIAIGFITNIRGLWYNSAGTRIWAAGASNMNLYYSTNNGTSWTTVTTGLSGIIYGFNISSNSSTAYILLTSGAVYSLNISGY